jgi:hypothetical protein
MQVRSTLMEIRRSWPEVFGHALTHDFGDVYRAKRPGKSHVERVRQAAFDFVFEDSALYRSVAEINKKYNIPEQPTRGRLAFWVLTEFVSAITGGPLDTRTKPEGVFPLAPGPGFDEWRRDFQSLADVVPIFQFHKQDIVTDFNAYANQVRAIYWPEFRASGRSVVLWASAHCCSARRNRQNIDLENSVLVFPPPPRR